jgi:hypothetical protein
MFPASGNLKSAFLHSEESGEAVSMQHQNTFNRAKRIRTSQFQDVKDKLLQYIKLRAQLYKRDKCGLSWTVLREKALYLCKYFLLYDLCHFS